MSSYLDVFKADSEKVGGLGQYQSLLLLDLVRAEQITVLDVLCLAQTCKTIHSMLKPIFRYLYEHVCGSCATLPVSSASAAYRFAVGLMQFRHCRRCAHITPVSQALPFHMHLCTRCVYQTGLSHAYPIAAHPEMRFLGMLPETSRLVRLADTPVPLLNTRGKMMQAVATIVDVHRYDADGSPNDVNGEYYWLPDLLVSALQRSAGTPLKPNAVRVRSPLASFDPYSPQQQHLSLLAADDAASPRKRRAEIQAPHALKRLRVAPSPRTPFTADNGLHLPPLERRRSKHRSVSGALRDFDETRRRLMYQRARTLTFSSSQQN